MHDVFKIRILDSVLRKPDALTQVEHRIMETNTLLGAEMLSGSELPVLRKARKIALCHQERGEGRSRVAALICGSETPLAAQIQVATTFRHFSTASVAITDNPKT